MPHVESGRVIHRSGLLLDGLDDFGTAVPGVHAPQAGGAVEHLAAIVGDIVHVLGADQQARRRLERAIRGEGHPKGVEGEVARVVGWHDDSK